MADHDESDIEEDLVDDTTEEILSEDIGRPNFC